MGETGSDRVVRQMGLTHEEFLCSLPAAVAGTDWRSDGPRILIEGSRRRVEVRLGPVQERRVGSLVLPRTEVSLRFEGFSAEERAGFLKRFDRAFQRGGG